MVGAVVGGASVRGRFETSSLIGAPMQTSKDAIGDKRMMGIVRGRLRRTQIGG
jgi:hypothetical protein